MSDSLLNIIIAALTGGLSGAMASLLAPWANWGIEKRRLRDCLKISQSSNKHAKSGHLDHRLARLRQTLIVKAETTMIVQPRQTTLDDPTLGQDRKAFALALDHLQDPSPEGLDSIRELPSIALIGKDLLQAGKALRELAQDPFGGLRLMEIGGMDHHGQQTTDRVDDDMTLASLDHLAPIETAFSAQFGRLHALAVDNSGTGCGVSAGVEAHALAGMTQDLVEGTISGPGAKVVVGALPGYLEVVGDHAPLTACFDEIQQHIDDHTEVVFSFSFDIEQGFDSFPLGVSQVGAVAWHRSGSLS